MFASQKEIAIGIITLVVMIVTIFGAFWIGQQNSPETPTLPTASLIETPATPTPLPTFTPTSTATPVPVVNAPTSTPTATPTSTATSTNTPTPTETLPPPPTSETASPMPMPTLGTPGTKTPTPPLEACKPPETWVLYQVVVGDTLDTLSRRTGVSVYELQLVNCLATSNLEPGQVIHLPIIPPEATTTFTTTPIPPATSTPEAAPTVTRTPRPFQPFISNVTPQVGALGREVLIFIQGQNFSPQGQGFRVELRESENGYIVRNLRLGDVRSSVNVEAIVPADLPQGLYDLYVINPGDNAAVFERAYTNNPKLAETPTPAPTSEQLQVFNVTPDDIDNDLNSVTLRVRGTGFRPTNPQFRVRLGRAGEEATIELDYVENTGSSTQFNALLPGNLDPGFYDLYVENDPGEQTIAPAELRIRD